MRLFRDRVLLYLSREARRVVDPGEVFRLEAVEGGTRVHLRRDRGDSQDKLGPRRPALFGPITSGRLLVYNRLVE